MDIQTYELDNGLRVLYKYIPYTRTVHCGYVINTGSRDDTEGKMGIAHFIEHMIFKGTAKRKTFHILNYLESVGGDLNAYTSKEKICLYASLMSDYFDRACELLTDITFHSTFPEKEINKEKQVISEEIDMYRNSPDEAIFEDFDELIFPKHSLGHPILGTKNSIRSITQDALKEHLSISFVQDQVIFGIVGNVKPKQVEKIIDKYLKHLEIPNGEVKRLSPITAPIREKKVKIETDQAHTIIGGRAYALRKDLYVPFLLLNNMLGGPAMNSRLNLNIREKYGLSYNINSFYSPYLDSGMWGIYFACEDKNIQRIRKLVFKELKQLRESPLGSLRLSQAKKQLAGQLTLGYENLLTQMLGMSNDLLDFGKLTSFSDFLKTINEVGAKEIMEAANEVFQEDTLSEISYRKLA